MDKLLPQLLHSFPCAPRHTKYLSPLGHPTLSENPLVSGFRKGIKKKKPPVSLKPATYYSLFTIFQHLRTLSADDTKCSLSVLRNKLITLLTIDGMARSADIESITRDTIQFTDSQVHFTFYNTKESKELCEIRPPSVVTMKTD